jgi:uncharacterized protein YkvS
LATDSSKVNVNIIKTCEDQDCFEFTTENNKNFRLVSENSCPWLEQGEDFKIEKLRTRLEPWLTALFQSEHLSLLVGSGITRAIAKLAETTVVFDMGMQNFRNFKTRLITLPKAQQH